MDAPAAYSTDKGYFKRSALGEGGWRDQTSESPILGEDT